MTFTFTEGRNGGGDQQDAGILVLCCNKIGDV